jgi:hypothetical protein
LKRALLLALAVCACAEEPEFVYVPAENYAISLQVSAPAQARAEAPAGFVPFGRPPPQSEPEVADNVRWFTDPGGATFDQPPHEGHRRKVRFDAPGTYRVWAHNAYPTEAKSNVVTVQVK